jgi:hypothetical protein
MPFSGMFFFSIVYTTSMLNYDNFNYGIATVMSIVSQDETGKPEALCHSRCGTINIPPSSKALSAEHMPKFCSPSSVMVTL